MKLIKLVFLLFLISFVIKCSSDTTEPEEMYSVSGYISSQGQMISGVSVSIDGNNTVLTGDDGYFKISEVIKGSHQLNIYKEIGTSQLSKIFDGDSSGFVERTYDIQVNDDLNLDSLKLPKAVYLFSASLDSTIVISWNSSEEESFREYKLYRHSSSGLDETTGELIHISTNRDDTTFIENALNLEPNTYYYRVYVMNDFGKLGGSNIINLVIPESILKITVNYIGQYSVSHLNKLFIGVSENPCQNECQDEGELYENNTTLEIKIESEFNIGQERKSVYGPYYLSTFLDITGNHQGAHLLPNGCPFVVYDNVNPLDAKNSCTSSPVYIINGEIKDITINLTDEFLTDNYTP